MRQGKIAGFQDFVICPLATVINVYRAWENSTTESKRYGLVWFINHRDERSNGGCNGTSKQRTAMKQIIAQMNQDDTLSVSKRTVQRTLFHIGLRMR